MLNLTLLFACRISDDGHTPLVRDNTIMYLQLFHPPNNIILPTNEIPTYFSFPLRIRNCGTMGGILRKPIQCLSVAATDAALSSLPTSFPTRPDAVLISYIVKTYVYWCRHSPRRSCDAFSFTRSEFYAFFTRMYYGGGVEYLSYHLFTSSPKTLY